MADYMPFKKYTVFSGHTPISLHQFHIREDRVLSTGDARFENIYISERADEIKVRQ